MQSALKGKRDRVLVATKFGNLALAGGGSAGLSGGHPDYVPQACEKSLKRLGVEVIDIYGLHRVDPTVPIEDTVGAMKKLVEQGKVRISQLSEAGRKPYAARTKCIRSWRSKPSIRCGAATSRRKSCRLAANSASVSWHMRRSGADFSPRR